MLINKSVHLTKEKQIQLGSYYTPKLLVEKVYELISTYLESRTDREVVIFDNAAGCGAFIIDMKNFDYRVADHDQEACSFLKAQLEPSRVYFSNSLCDVSREKYKIPNNSFLIQIGNPPYNDTTSEFKNGKKGENESDDDLFDRDLGVSFLKSYSKLRADIVCVLHPLSYLIKEANFLRLRQFKDNYILKRGIIFPSSFFSGTGYTKFPVVIGLYERNWLGMDYNYIRRFDFEVLDSSEKFRISDYQTTDGYVHKYPPRKNDSKISPIGLYYYSFRDFNSLRRNASFLTEVKMNSIVVNVENFYQYAYLHALKHLFIPRNAWLYGNLSPLLDTEMLESNKALFVNFAINHSPAVKSLDQSVKNEINQYYDLTKIISDPSSIRPEIQSKLNKLVD